MRKLSYRFVLALAAVVAGSAIAASVASAARIETCDPNGSGVVNLCIEGKEAGSPTSETIPFSIKKKPGTQANLAVSGGLTIECEKAEGAGEFETSDSTQVAVSDLKIALSGRCAIANAIATCKVKEPVVWNGGGDLIDGAFKNIHEVTFAPSEGAILATYKIENQPGKTCLFKGTVNVSGTFTDEVVAPESEKVAHELKVVSEDIRYGETSATLQLTEEAELSGASEKGLQYSLFKSNS